MMWRFALCLLACCSPLSGQSSAYRTLWTHIFEKQKECDALAAVDEKSELWVVCQSSNDLQWESRVLHIASDGRLISEQEYGFALTAPPGALVERILDCPQALLVRLGLRRPKWTTYEGPTLLFIGEVAIAANQGRIGLVATVGAPSARISSRLKMAR